MSFDDELKKLILDAGEKQEQKRKDVSGFGDAWRETKLNVVKPALDQAVKALKAHSRFDAKVEMRNGSIHLKMGPKPPPENIVTHELIFSPIEEKLEVACSSSNTKLEPENFTLDKLDQRTVESKIKEFLSAALG